MGYFMQDRAGNFNIQLAGHASDFLYVFPDCSPLPPPPGPQVPFLADGRTGLHWWAFCFSFFDS